MKTPEEKREARRKRCRRWRAKLSPEKREKYREASRRRGQNRTSEQREKDRAAQREHYANLTPDQKAARYAKQRECLANFTSEHLEEHREAARKRHRARTPEQVEAHREKDRKRRANFSPERDAAAREAARNRVRHNRLTPEGRAKALIRGATTRSTRQGIPGPDYGWEWIADQIKIGCEVTGLPFDLNPNERGRQRNNPFAPSLDQVTPGDGYERANVRGVLWAVNSLFADYTSEECRRLAPVWRTVADLIREGRPG